MLIMSVNSFTQPLNDDCTNAIELIPTTTVSMEAYTFDGATKDQSLAIGPAPYEDVFFKFTATSYLHNVIVDATNSPDWMDIGLIIMEGDCASGFTSLAGINYPMTVYSNRSVCRYDGFNPGTEYYILLSNSNGSNLGQYSIMITEMEDAGEFCMNAINVATDQQISGSNFFSSMDGEMGFYEPEDLCAITLENGIWYEFVAPATGNYSIVFDNMDYIGGPGSNVAYGHQIGVFESVSGDCVSDMTPLDCDSSEYHFAQLNAWMTQGNIYRIVVEGDAGCLVSYDFTINSPLAKVEEVNHMESKVYPTVVKDQLTIETNQLNHPNIEIVDARGLIIQRYTENKSDKISINVSDFVNGYYLVRINSDSGTETFRILK